MCKVQESIQSSTTADPGHHLGKERDKNILLYISKMLMQIYQKIQVTTYTKKILIHVKATVPNI